MVKKNIQKKILIATPTAGNIVKTFYMQTVISLCKALHERSIDYEFKYFDSADVITARNYFANMVYEDKNFSHLLFIDSDMSFDINVILKALEFDKEVIGLVASTRNLNMSDFIRHIVTLAGKQKVIRGEDVKKCISSSVRYNVYELKAHDRNFITEGDFFTVRAIGTGILLIKREAFERIVQKNAAIRKANHFKRGGIPMVEYYDFFDPIYVSDENNNDYISEDLSFCVRWRDRSGGTIWAYSGYDVGHHGDFRYNGHCKDTLPSDE